MIRLNLRGRGGRVYRALARRGVEVIPDLPDPMTMPIEDLRAEVEGGREAFGVLVGTLEDLRAELAHTVHNLHSAHQAIHLVRAGKL